MYAVHHIDDSEIVLILDDEFTIYAVVNGDFKELNLDRTLWLAMGEIARPVTRADGGLYARALNAALADEGFGLFWFDEIE